eukprot:6466360-Amphidinium_carterae.2
MDKALAHANAILEKVNDTTLLSKLGLQMGGDGDDVSKKYDMIDPVLGIQDDLACCLADLAVALVGRRLRTMSQHLGLPPLFAGLMGIHHQDIIDTVRRQWNMWQCVQPCRSAYWSKVKARSFFNHAKVQQIVQLLEESDWQLSDQVLSIVRSDYTGITQTELIEDGFRLGRVSEVNAGFCKNVAVERLYDRLISSDLAGEIHRYPHIDADNFVVGKGLQSRDVVTSKSTCPYHSPAPMLCTAPLEDLRVWQWCKDVHDDLSLAERAWLSVLVVPNAFMLMHPKCNDGKYCLGLRSFTGVVAYGLPLDCIKLNGKEFWTPCPLKETVFLPIVMPEDWVCVKIGWMSPVAVAASSQRWCGKKGILLAPVGSPTSLLKLAAAEGFWSIPKAGLRRLAKEFELEVDGTAPLHQM